MDAAREPELPGPVDELEVAVARRGALLRLGLLAGAVIAVFLAGTATGGLPSAERIRDWVEDFGVAGPLVFVALAATLNCVFVPGPMLAGAAGLLFGTALGTPVALAGAVGAATLQLLIARHVARRQVQAILPARVRRLDDFLERRGFFAVFYARLAPAIPYVLTNYGAGLTRLPLSHMVAGTALGAGPKTFAYVALGGSLDNLGSPEALIAIALLLTMAVGGAVFARSHIRGR